MSPIAHAIVSSTFSTYIVPGHKDASAKSQKASEGGQKCLESWCTTSTPQRFGGLAYSACMLPCKEHGHHIHSR